VLTDFELKVLLNSSRFSKQQQYWSNKLAGSVVDTDLPFLRKINELSHNGLSSRSVEISIPEEVSHRVVALGKNSGLSLYIILLSVLKSLVYRYTANEDIIVISPLIKSHTTEETINDRVFIRNQLNGELSFMDLLLMTRKSVQDAYEHQDYPSEQLIENLFQFRTISHLVCSLVNLHEFDPDSFHDKLRFSFMKSDERITGTVTFSPELYDPQSLECAANHFSRLLESLTGDVHHRISEISLLPPEEERQLIHRLTGPEIAYTNSKTLHGIFEEQALRTPHACALVCGNVQLTYSQLNSRANQLARVLRSKGIGPEQIVGMATRRSPEMIIGILAILKAGAAYLPIDCEYPTERIKYMLSTSGITLLLNHADLPGDIQPVVEILDMTNPDLYSGDDSDLDNNNQPEGLAYIIFTSGTMGQPKGVMIEHQGITNTIQWRKDEYRLNESDSVLQLFSYAFDGFLTSLFTPLVSGARVVLLSDEDSKDPVSIKNSIVSQGITHFICVPTLFMALLEQCSSSDLKSLRVVTLAGEKVTDHLLSKCQALKTELELANEYGPTEASVLATFYRNLQKSEMLSIGRPIPNVQTYIMDQNLFLQPVGVPGEICIGGRGLARGYLNNPELTFQKFTSNPLDRGKKMYRTGDLSRCLPDGNIDFLGRIDNQVKIRGFRIELNEIESHLLSYDGIREAVVLSKNQDNGGSPYLCAYLASPSNMDDSRLREYLSQKLPVYMIPSFFVRFKELPRTPLGKVDFKKLPEPQKDSSTSYVAPSTAIENELVEVWKKVLNRERISINENFFMIGGDSIKAIQIAARMNKAGYKLRIRDIFLHPVLSELAAGVKKSAQVVAQSLVTGEVPLTPIQRWFFEQNIVHQHHFNHAVMLRSEEKLQVEALETTFRKILEHHDALRMTFNREGNGKISQTVLGMEYPLSIDCYDFRNQEIVQVEIEETANRIQKSISLENGPLMKVAVFHLNDCDRLLIVVHHLVIDGISWRILLEDFGTLYQQYKNGQPLMLPPKTDSFKSWSAHIVEYANSESFLKEKPYWQSLTSQATQPLKPDFSDGDDFVQNSTTLSFCLDEKETELLLTHANFAFGTEINDVLLIALGLSIREIWGMESVPVALEGHGRENILEDIDVTRTLGWFTTIFPVVLDVSGNELSRQIKTIKEHLHQMPNKGIGYLILRYLTTDDKKPGIDFTLAPQISFNYLGQFDSHSERSFHIAKESPGRFRSPEAVREYALEVVGMISGDRLSMSITYGAKRYRAETIASLINSYHSNLTKVIAYCAQRRRRECTPSDFTFKDLTLEQLDVLTATHAIDDIYTLTPMQEGMLFHALVEKNSATYFEQISYSLVGDLDRNLVQDSLNELLKRHDILRSAFVYEGFERPLQIVLRDRQVDFLYEDLRRKSPDQKDAYLKHFKLQDRNRSFDLSADVLMRVSMLQSEENQYEFIWSFHHILMDAWCSGILISEFKEIYNSLFENRAHHLPAVVPYKNYIRWLQQRDGELSSRYWREYLSGYDELAHIPPLKTGQPDHNEIFALKFSPEQSKRLNRWSGRQNVTLNTVMQSLWGIVLSRYCGKRDVVFGVVVAGRPAEISGVESMVGLFINTIPVRICYERNIRFHELVKLVQNKAIDSEPHHYFPLAQIQAQSELRQNLLDHIYVFENLPLSEQIDGLLDNRPGVELEIRSLEVFEQTNYSFSLTVIPGDVLTVHFTFNAAIYAKPFVEQVAGHLLHVADQVMDDDEITIDAISLLSPRETQWLIHEFNNTAADYQLATPIPVMIEQTVNEHRDSIAVAFDEQKMGYGELNGKANSLAAALQQRGIGSGSYVPVLMTRGFELPISLLAVMKTGAAFVPLDINWPVERLLEVIKNIGCRTVLINQNFDQQPFATGDCEALTIDHTSFAPDAENLSINVTMDDPMYVIFTSGSTGKPKGAVNHHRGIANRFLYMNKRYRCTSDDVVLLNSNHAFDAAVWQLFWPMINGIKTVIPPQSVSLDLGKLADLIERERVTITDFVPSVFNTLVDFITTQPAINEKLRSLRQLLIGGEAMMAQHIYDFKSRLKNVSITNTYGPAEASIGTVFFEIPNQYRDPIPIGKPIDNVKTLVLDKELNLVPLGATGELYLGGVCVGLGYLNEPERTREVFLNLPVKDLENDVFYKTGDKVRINFDGNIEFLGRTDLQVKIRGVRVELSEIERHLLKHDAIKEAVVLAKSRDGGESLDLYAYIVPQKEVFVTRLREHLSSTLPHYMIPSYFISIEKIPLTSNGKVDTKALDQYGKKLGMETDYLAPNTEVEKRVAAVWKEVLRLDSVGVDDNFFDLGGTSLDIIRLNGRIKEAFDMENAIVRLIQFPTIRSFAQFIIEGQNDRETNRSGKVDLARTNRARQRAKRKGISTFQKDNFEKHSRHYGERVRNREKYRNLDLEDSIIVEFLNKHQMDDQSVLIDAGCGTGDRLALLFGEKGLRRSRFAQIIGLDYAQAMLNYARNQQIDGEKLYAELHLADLLNLHDFPQGDVTLCLWGIVNGSCLEVTKLLADVAKMVKKDGILIYDVATMKAESDYRLRQEILLNIHPELTPHQDQQTFWYQREDRTVGYFRLFSPQELNVLSHATGLTLVDAWGYSHDGVARHKLKVAKGKINEKEAAAYPGVLFFHKRI